jgi:hypothetical protein
MATLSNLTLQPMIVAAARTTSANGAAIDLATTPHTLGRQMKAILDVGVITTAGTLDVKMQEDTTSGFGAATDISGAVFTQVTSATGNEQIHFRATKRYVRAVATFGAATNGYTFGVYLLTENRIT